MAEDLHAQAAGEAVTRLFDRIGIDFSDRSELRQLGRDLVFLRGLREGAEEREELLRRHGVERPARLVLTIAEKLLTFGLGLLGAYLLFRWGLK